MLTELELVPPAVFWCCVLCGCVYKREKTVLPVELVSTARNATQKPISSEHRNHPCNLYP